MDNGRLGERLRALRLRRALSLAEVACGTGLSQSFISLVETGKSDISVSRLIRLVDFYRVRLTDVIPEDVPKADQMVVRKDEQRHLYSREEGLDVYLLGPDAAQAMLPVIAEYEPTGKWAEFVGHEGEVFLHVLEGRIEIEIEGHEPVTLKPGDSAYFRSEQRQRFRNPGKQKARLIAVASPASA